jgi:hypothetical protein
MKHSDFFKFFEIHLVRVLEEEISRLYNRALRTREVPEVES